MRVKFVHPKVPDKFVWYDVPDELPPIIKMAFPMDVDPSIPRSAEFFTPKKFAIFHRRSWYVEDRTTGKIRPTEYIYEFFQWCN